MARRRAGLVLTDEGVACIMQVSASTAHVRATASAGRFTDFGRAVQKRAFDEEGSAPRNFTTASLVKRAGHLHDASIMPAW